ncbi:ATP-binding protein [Flocculibacter collagenilyticus]|uniref:ATP-binding protein n=1 Tax=Flocculibacter collagenilyticus TaxID=2744479 RepID=UPI0018F79B52|nr:ATP-binding protein [Flocculibacter collagenilyticus]
MDKEKLKLKIDAHVIQQLGAELISGPEIALLELIKNSHDADASFCYIDVDTNYTETIDHIDIVDGEEIKTPITYKGKISIRDNGHGMDRSRINRSWLTVSYSEKKEAKKNNKVTEKFKRSLTGDKGLGRLGSMQLGTICRISTQSKPENEGICVSFSWDDFIHGKTLDSVHVSEQAVPAKKETGTIIEAIGIKNLAFWEGAGSIEFPTKIASMVSPHGQISKFKTFYVHNGLSIELETFSEHLLEQASSIFDFNLDGDFISVTGMIELLPFKPNTNNRKAVYEEYINSDNGVQFFHYLKEQATLNDFKMELLEGKYFLKFEHMIELGDVDLKLSQFAHPGGFESRIYNFLLSKEALDIEDLSFTKIKESIKTIAGDISPYRDGFRIGSNNKDWLGLSNEMTSGAGAYSLRPSNVTGYINLSSNKNKALIEKSDRESFVDNIEYRSFYAICQYALSTINKFLNTSRRRSLDYLDDKILKDAGKPKGYSARLATVELDNLVKKSVTLQPKVTKQVDKIKTTFLNNKKQIDDSIAKNQQDMYKDPVLEKELLSIKKMLNFLEEETNSNLANYKSFNDELASHVHSTKKVLDEIKSYENQIKNFYDHVAIGLSAQTLAHEANEQTRNIRFHLDSAKKRINELGIKDSKLTKELNGIRGDSQTLSKSISSLNPLVKAQREVIEKLNISDFIEDYVNLRTSYFERKLISIKISDKGDSKLIQFNRGKLFQIIDNIVRNSEHWLAIYQIHNPEHKCILTIDIDRNKVTIWDNAKGIRPPLEDVLFDMFASDKEFGQGLGLYITKTLLSEKNCSISLLQERNTYGRRFKFEIDLIEAIV